jgi:hypothetical protein
LYDIDPAVQLENMYINMLQRIINKGKRRRAPGRTPLDEGHGITIRFAYPDDTAALRRLATLDSKPVPSGPLLVAEVGSELWAAVSVTEDGPPIADPFRYTAELVTVLQERAQRLVRPPRRAQASQRVAEPAYE